MFTLRLKTEDKTTPMQDMDFANRAEAQTKVNFMYAKKKIDLSEWRRITNILSEPNING